eukprot:TRINITY_DN364_c0_g1_i1.p1 TRINITY_DN364_c0_g1~~TRINITY_DN364_c0_g1_i1.p1  ORF type:complete len:450 (-),score=73.63 TRINITY_DN364_c0_g1_i1:14-1363(-)
MALDILDRMVFQEAQCVSSRSLASTASVPVAEAKEALAVFAQRNLDRLSVVYLHSGTNPQSNAFELFLSPKSSPLSVNYRCEVFAVSPKDATTDNIDAALSAVRCPRKAERISCSQPQANPPRITFEPHETNELSKELPSQPSQRGKLMQNATDDKPQFKKEVSGDSSRQPEPPVKVEKPPAECKPELSSNADSGSVQTTTEKSVPGKSSEKKQPKGTNEKAKKGTETKQQSLQKWGKQGIKVEVKPEVKPEVKTECSDHVEPERPKEKRKPEPDLSKLFDQESDTEAPPEVPLTKEKPPAKRSPKSKRKRQSETEVAPAPAPAVVEKPIPAAAAPSTPVAEEPKAKKPRAKKEPPSVAQGMAKLFSKPKAESVAHKPERKETEASDRKRKAGDGNGPSLLSFLEKVPPSKLARTDTAGKRRKLVVKTRITDSGDFVQEDVWVTDDDKH